MEYSVNPQKLQDTNGRSYVVVSQVEGGFLTRDETTSGLVYFRDCDLPCDQESANSL